MKYLSKRVNSDLEKNIKRDRLDMSNISTLQTPNEHVTHSADCVQDRSS